MGELRDLGTEVGTSAISGLRHKQLRAKPVSSIRVSVTTLRGVLRNAQ